MKISAIIPFRDRIAEVEDPRLHCRPVLHECCRRLFKGGVHEVVIGNVGPESVLPMPDNIGGRVREVRFPLNNWNTCLPRQMAAQIAVGDVLLFTLADNPLYTVGLLRDFCDIPRGIIRTAERDCDVTGQAALDAMAGLNPNSLKVDRWWEDGFHLGRFMAIRREDFFDIVRGWDIEMFHWGYNDRDFLARCELLGIRQDIFPGMTSVHIDHPRLDTSKHEQNKKMSEDKIASDWWGYRG